MPVGAGAAGLGLSWLTTGKEDTPEFQILDDYAKWHANY
jgi:hypothetical protein